jgi:hypothetical protein
LKGKQVNGFANLELDEEAVEMRLLDYMRQIPMAAKPLGIRMLNKVPNTEDVQRVAEDRLFVKVQLSLN